MTGPLISTGELELEGKRLPRQSTHTILSNRQRVWRKFRRHKLAMVSGGILFLMYSMVIFADLLAPYGETTIDKNRSYISPTPLRIWDGKSLSRPFIYEKEEVFNPETLINSFEEDRSKKYPLRLFVKGEPYKMWGVIPWDRHLFGVDPPAKIYLFGADLHGRDILSRLLFGGRVSLTIGYVALLLVIPIGMLVGGISGYYGGQIDNILMRVVEAFLSFPSFYLLLALAATLPINISSVQRFLLIVAILSFVNWAGLARVIRGQVLAIREMEYIASARAMGSSDLRIIVKHILPQTSSWVIVSASLSVPIYILFESGLSLIGLGIQEPYASWGNMLFEARKVSSLSLHPWILVSGAAITLSIMAFNFLGDGLRDAFDTKKRI